MTADQPIAPGGLFRGPPAYVPSTPWPPWRALLAAVVILAISTIAVALAAPALVELSSQGNGTAAETLALGLWQSLVVLLTLLAAGMFGGRLRDVLGLRDARGGPAVYVQAVLVLAALNAVVSAVQFSVVPQDMYADLRPFVHLMTGPGWGWALLVVGIGAPLSEELLFRGFLLSALSRSALGFAGASLVTTGIWAALHASYSVAGIVEVFLVGLFFCWLVWRTGSVRIALFCHALYNSILVLILRYVPLPA